MINYKKQAGSNESKAVEKELDIFENSIFSDFGEILDINPNSVDLDLAIIERCVNKGLCQQALTFIETLMPRYFVEKKFIFCNEDDMRKIENAPKKNDYKEKKIENIVFDSNLPFIPGYVEKSTAITSIISQYSKKDFENIEVVDGIKKMKNKMFKDMYDKEKKEFGEQHSIKAYGLEDEIQIDVFTNFNKNEQKKIAEIFFIHKILKECRNIFNHGKSSEDLSDNGQITNEKKQVKRPKIDDIDAVIKKYIKNVKVLNKALNN